MVDKEEKKLAVNWEDQIVAETCIIRDGKIVHPALGGQQETPKEETPAEAAEEKSDDSSDGQGG